MVNFEKLKTEVNLALDKAENIWKKVEPEFLLEGREFSAVNLSKEKIETQIPGHAEIEENKPEVGDFIAFVLDIRNSTKHLTQAITSKTTNVSQLERVLYEITAINTAGAIVIDNYSGGITEYLGDGFLSIFKIVNSEEPTEIYDAHNAAKYYINTALPEINKIIKDRYNLPPLEIGIGMAYSKAIVTTVGIEPNLHPKAIGECVYRASKLSSGKNDILIDNRLKNLWPSTKNGTLRFINISRNERDFDAFKVSK